MIHFKLTIDIDIQDLHNKLSQRYQRPTKCFQTIILQKKKDNTKSCEYVLKLNQKMILVIWQHTYLQHRMDTKMKSQNRVNFTTAVGQFLEPFLTMEWNLIVGGLQS